jgi:hypothetical protein
VDGIRRNVNDSPFFRGECAHHSPHGVRQAEPDALRKPVEEAKGGLEKAQAEAKALMEKARAAVAEAKEAYRAALAPYRSTRSRRQGRC